MIVHRVLGRRSRAMGWKQTRRGGNSTFKIRVSHWSNWGVLYDVMWYIHVETVGCVSLDWVYGVLFYGSVRTWRVNSGLTQFVAATRACDITCPPNTPRVSKFRERFLERYRLRSSCSTSRADEMSLGSASFLSIASAIGGNREEGGHGQRASCGGPTCGHLAFGEEESRVGVIYGYALVFDEPYAGTRNQHKGHYPTSRFPT